MINPPLTKKEAEAYIYNRWGGNPKGDAYDPKYCAFAIFQDYHPRQCGRRPTSGPDKLYCSQHGSIVNALVDSLLVVRFTDILQLAYDCWNDPQDELEARLSDEFEKLVDEGHIK